MRDLTGEAPDAIAAERSRVATEGWGAQLLARQTPAGHWDGPKWDLITLYSLVVLKDLGLDPASKQAWILNTGKYTLRLDGNPDGHTSGNYVDIFKLALPKVRRRS